MYFAREIYKKIIDEIGERDEITFSNAELFKYLLSEHDRLAQRDYEFDNYVKRNKDQRSFR